MKQYRVTKAIPGRLVGNRFVASRKNPDFTETPLGKLGLGVISLGTPAGLTKSGKLRKNPKEKKKGGGSNNSGDTSTDVRSPTSTSTEVRSPTKTETRAQTQGNFTATVTGGAGDGANTTVTIKPNGTKRRGNPFQELPRDKWIPAMVRIIGDGTFELVLEAV